MRIKYDALSAIVNAKQTIAWAQKRKELTHPAMQGRLSSIVHELNEIEKVLKRRRT